MNAERNQIKLQFNQRQRKRIRKATEQKRDCHGNQSRLSFHQNKSRKRKLTKHEFKSHFVSPGVVRTTKLDANHKHICPPNDQRWIGPVHNFVRICVMSFGIFLDKQLHVDDFVGEGKCGNRTVSSFVVVVVVEQRWTVGQKLTYTRRNVLTQDE